MAENRAPGELKDWQIKQREFEQVKARAKNAKLRTTCTICGANRAKACQGCGTTAYLFDGVRTHRLARARAS